LIKLYDTSLSSHCHKVRLLLSILKIPHEIIPMDFMAGDHKQSDFLKLNPLGQIPVLVDGDVVLRDSNAIQFYLAAMFDKTKGLWPSVPADAARVMQWISIAANELDHGPAAAREGVYFGMPRDIPKAQENTRAIFKIMNDHLATREWLELERPTLADLACYTCTALAPLGGVPLEPYANLSAWCKRVEALPGFVAAP
jgi:glutathione S-transferase